MQDELTKQLKEQERLQAEELKIENDRRRKKLERYHSSPVYRFWVHHRSYILLALVCVLPIVGGLVLAQFIF